MDKFDVAIIGAGPSGISCALTLLKNNYQGKIVIFETGNFFDNRYCSVDNGDICLDCSPCNTITGFGGAIHYGDTVKLSCFPSGKRLFNLIGKSSAFEYQEIAKSYFQVTSKDFVTPSVQELKLEVDSYPIAIIDYVNVKKVISSWFDILEKHKNVKVVFNSSLKNIEKVNDKFYLKIEDKKAFHENRILVDKVILGVGREGLFWLKDNLNLLKIPKKQPKISIGFRFLVPSKILSKASSIHPDFKTRIQYKGIKYKTFCFSAGESGGRIKHANYKDFVLIDGHTFTGKDNISNYSNFAILTQLVDNIHTFDWVKENILIRYIKLNSSYPGKPIIQRYSDFKNKISSNFEVKEINDFNAQNYKSDDLSCFISNDQHEGFCHVFEKLLDEFLRLSDIVIEREVFFRKVFVLGVELEGIWDEVEVDTNMQTPIQGLYVIGDCAGLAQGIMQASVSGIVAAKSIL